MSVSVGCMGDTQFHFRIRQCSSRKLLHASYTDYNRGCPSALQVGRRRRFESSAILLVILNADMSI